MAQTKFLTGNCPKCGEALDIPAHLKQFSCLYCGARLTPAELAVTMTEEPIPQADGAACAAYYRAHVLDTIVNHPGIEKEMTRSGYSPAFERYSLANEETFCQLELAVQTQSITLEEAVAYYLDQLENRWTANVKWNKSRHALLENDKFVIAIFLVPMIRRLELSISETFCTILQSQWVSRYPKSPFYLGNYEDLAGGFQKKYLGLCYITTAVCLQDGKPDDCAELTAFRNFRDGYLRSCPDGPALIDEYYHVAPSIVLHIDLSADREAKYAAIRDTYLIPCYQDIQAGALQRCKERYTAMVENLKQEYLN